MCGRFTMTASIDVVQDLFELQSAPPRPEATYNIAPTQQVLTVREEADVGPQAELMRWGLIPFWAEDKSIGARLINARGETVAEKPAFRDAYANRRCLVVADGFFEWEKIDGRKQPYWIRLADGGPFGFAGLWERWRDETGAWLKSCTIVTTRANELVAKVHDRMPVILPVEHHATWLSAASDPDELRGLLVPLPADRMKATAVSTRVNSVRNDDEACVAAAGVQGSLL